MIDVWIFSVLWVLFGLCMVWVLIDYRDYVKMLGDLLFVLIVRRELLPGSIHNKECDCWLCKPPPLPSHGESCTCKICMPIIPYSYVKNMFKDEDV